MENQTLDQSLNIGSEVRLFEGCVKNIEIGTIKTIREIRQKMKDVKFKFSFCIGRDAQEEADFPAYEQTYREVFDMVLVDGLSDDEYEQVDEEGLKVLDTILDRFLF